jgi:hypothetical protein
VSESGFIFLPAKKTMSNSETTVIVFKDKDGNTVDGEMFTTRFDSGDRSKRALGRLAACWAAAGVTLFIPLAHVVLVPAFLIAGPALAVAAYRQEFARERVEGQCPACQAAVEIKLEPKDTLPKWRYCPACNASLQIVEKG